MYVYRLTDVSERETQTGVLWDVVERRSNCSKLILYQAKGSVYSLFFIISLQVVADAQTDRHINSYEVGRQSELDDSE